VTHALSSAGLARIREFVTNRALLAFDIDGTLAPIVSQPWDARIPDASQSLLADLAAHHSLAIITGRGAADARRMLKFTPRYLVGSHGAEGVPGFEAAAQTYAKTCAAWLKTLHSEGEAWKRMPGVTLEEKTYSLAFHYRHADDQDEARRIMEARIHHLSPWPCVVPGKCVLNFVPRDAPHKGDALRALLSHCGCDRALYVGDDVTDEDVFRMKLPGVLSVHIDPPLASDAELFLTNQREVQTLLEALVLVLDERVPTALRQGE
jgi:trehalose 6-phosphate phosphatase